LTGSHMVLRLARALCVGLRVVAAHSGVITLPCVTS
jgi:hypothetical protein